MIDFNSLLKDATNSLNELQKIQQTANFHVNNAIGQVKDKPEFEQALKELEKAKQQVENLQKELRNVTSHSA